ncbi:MAG: hypothetical protein V4696_12060 [Pseudomonadota bacterium]
MTATLHRAAPSEAMIRWGTFGITFYAAGDFAASDQAEVFLKEAGFSLGSSRRGAPTACMFGDYTVSKWRNLNHDERRETHATLTGDRRNGPLSFRLLPAAPDEAVQAIEAAIAKATGK